MYANDLNQQLSQPVAFLARKPIANHSQATTQSLAASTSTPITMDTQITDPWGMRTVSGDTSQLTVRAYTDGIWFVQGFIPMAASVNSSSYFYETDIFINGSVYTRGERWASLGSHVTPGVADIIPCPAGTEIQLVGYQTSTAAVSTFSNTVAFPYMSARWVAANNTLPGGQMPASSQTYQGPNGNQVYIPPNGSEGPLLTAPNPGTWTTLEEATSSQFNNDIRNSVLFMANVPVYRAIENTSQSVSASTSTPITNMLIETDNWGAGSSTVWTAPISGAYLVGGQVAYTTASSAMYGYAELICDISGTTSYYLGNRVYGETIASMVLRVIRFSAGDTVQLGAWSSASTTTYDGSNTRLFTLWLSQ